MPHEIGLVPALLSIAKSTRAMHGLKLAECGFSNGQDELLLAIPEGGLAVNELADRLMVRPSTVSKMTDRLIEKGLIRRIADGSDGRRTIVRITASGIRARARLIQARSDLDDDLTKPLGEEACAALQARLTDCVERLAKRLRRLR
ncbi:hypothetical protein ASG43_10900 [Aureimonas sp. Leaf454]|uniref:MarR family winged helix-turn-helix transcriptional regulator n=1 Tax=Aureimonas sp. Leaf454 TaxID=1736381 RepID=UPI0006F8F613|nr:MarR family winged helix-turn-helix transcriptional regulator [Aureimonas sp. Leaf454]KQT47577.1 hypothetical protein ASG43_10900 [Aureimonas sp. Leaf454]